MKSEIPRRAFLALGVSVGAIRRLSADVGIPAGRLGICSFSCHRQWEAVRTRVARTQFSDSATFYDYARSIGADGVQTSLSKLNESRAVELRRHVEAGNGYLEGDLRIPRDAKDLDKFEREIVLTKLAGATVARSFLSGGRRYETWKSRSEFLQFVRDSELRLALIEPILEKHRFKLAIENHKDFTSDEMLELLRQFDSEWLGVNVDTGNNIALLEDPYEAVEKLAPLAMSVHLKDMVVQVGRESEFLLSEVPCGQGFLDLKRMCKSLLDHNPDLIFNLEMATRDPLKIPYKSELYWKTFGEKQDADRIAAVDAMIAANSPEQTPPSLIGRSPLQQIADEEANNRVSLVWMHRELG